MLPLIGAGLSVIGGIAGNAQASANAKAQAKQAYRNFGIQVNTLKETAEDINREIGMELTNAVFEGMKMQSATANEIVEREVVGNTMARVYNNVSMKETMAKNQLKQKAEASMVDVQNNMMEQKMNYENQMMQVQTQQINSTKSAFELGAGALTTYMTLGGTSSFLSGGASQTVSEGLASGTITPSQVSTDAGLGLF